MYSVLYMETASSAAEAIHFLKIRSVDWFISDYQMPEMDGIEFFKHIRANIGLLPFILLNGRGREEVVIEAFSKGYVSIRTPGYPLGKLIPLPFISSYPVVARLAGIFAVSSAADPVIIAIHSHNNGARHCFI